MQDKPLLLLDVDGVLNALKADMPEGWRRGVYNGYTLSWNPEVTNRLALWHTTGLVEIQWLTTWTHDADALLADDMGLPRSLVTHSYYHENPKPPQKFSLPFEWWKLSHAIDIVAEQPSRRIVWIDDDHGYDRQAIDFVKANPQILAVQPNPYDGVSMAQLDMVEAWLNA